MHDHSHGSTGHHHAQKNEKKLAFAAALTGAFMLAEVFGGLLSGSLALLADAGHMLTDFASLMLAWVAVRLARRPADWKLTYGFGRFSVLAAFVNGLSLFAISIWIGVEAIGRLAEPREVLGGMMFWVALGGLIVNIIAFLILTRGEGDNLNVRAAALHVAGDLLGSVAAIIASVVILYTGWTPIDPILSILVTLLILRSAWAIVKESAHVLLEGAPGGFDKREVGARLPREVNGLSGVAHLHAWSVTQERPMATLEISVSEGHDAAHVTRAVKDWFRHEAGISHTVVELKSGSEDQR